MAAEFGTTVSFTFDAVTSQFVLQDSDATAIQTVDVKALFGAETAAAVQADATSPYALNLSATFMVFAVARGVFR